MTEDLKIVWFDLLDPRLDTFFEKVSITQKGAKVHRKGVNEVALSGHA